jgi:DEAD/DEAH box helicase domain-containing protein
MPLASLLDFWKRDPETAPNLVAWRTLPPRPAQRDPIPDDVPAPLKQTLIASGIHTLYSHQLEAWTLARAGENIILATGTASGKTHLQPPVFTLYCRTQCPLSPPRKP